MRIAPALVFALMCANAQSAPLSLLCDGESFHFPNGFAEKSTKVISSRVFAIDIEANTVRADTFFGIKTTNLGTWSNDRIFGFEIPLDQAFAGRRVVNETVTINRFTGLVEAYYKVQPDDPASLGFSSFKGHCKKAEPNF